MNKKLVVFWIILSFVFLHNCKKEKSTLPTVQTIDISAITQTTATIGGTITDDGGMTIISRGICWSTEHNPLITNRKTVDGAGAGTFFTLVVGLKPNTIYYARAFATNESGTGYGMVMSFTTDDYGSVTDIDGNKYKTININNQTWMAENLKVTKYNDGVSINNVISDGEWENLTSGAYCYYNDDPVSFKDLYGAL